MDVSDNVLWRLKLEDVGLLDQNRNSFPGEDTDFRLCQELQRFKFLNE